MRSVVFVLIFLTQNLLAAEAGRLVLSGNGCSPLIMPDTTTLILSEQNQPYEVPFAFKLEKAVAPKIVRKTCNLALPIKLGKNEKVQISNIQQDLLFTHKLKTSVKAILSLFFVGSNSKQTKNWQAELKSDDPAESLQKLWNDDSTLLESPCGKDIILRGNFSVFAEGDSSASLTSNALKFSIKLVHCD